MYSSKSATSYLRRLRGVAAPADPGPHRGRRVVRVDLVADQQERAGPLVLAGAGQPFGERDEDVGIDAPDVAARRRLAARPEREPQRAAGIERPDPARRPARVGRPGALAVQQDLVRRRRARVEPVDRDDRVVVAGDVKGPIRGRRGARPDLDDARGARLHPDRRVPRADVPQERAEDECGHAAGCLHCLLPQPVAAAQPHP